ncbi:hypothetical protein [Synechocystis sp. LKSZ1]|uniref:hypothetical protein n=1 Tax=Synechocystis sp. LKSZ1 TaxID=3144951 RepID=UPI00336BFB58
MNNDPQGTPETPMVEVISDNPSLVTQSAPETKTPDEVAQETQALLEAIRTKAIDEANKAGTFARDSYLEAMRNARQQVETLNLFDPERIEAAIKQLQSDVEKDWEGLVTQVNDFGDRLSESAKAAWEALTQDKTK